MDLLLTLDRFRSVDTTNQGHVNSGQFSEVELWFTGQPWLENPEDPDLPPVFDRQGKLPSVRMVFVIVIIIIIIITTTTISIIMITIL